MPDLIAPQIQMSTGDPDRLVMFVGVSPHQAQNLASEAVSRARNSMPRITGAHARNLAPVAGPGYFGIYFPDRSTWFLEHGTRPHTMRSLQGKTIPMWVEDKDGQLRAKNQKIKVRRTEDGRTQVLIFRKVAPIGQRKTITKKDKATGQMITTTTPASYPGAPGRIGARSGNGRIAGGNVGVRWRHPGLKNMQFLNAAIAETAYRHGFMIQELYATDEFSLDPLARRMQLQSAAASPSFGEGA